MKIRFGFVSNSSSSSFLIVGASIGSKKFSDGEIEKLDEATVNVYGDNDIVGLALARWDDSNGIDQLNLPISEIAKRADEVFSILKEYGFKQEDIKLFAGTEYN